MHPIKGVRQEQLVIRSSADNVCDVAPFGLLKLDFDWVEGCDNLLYAPVALSKGDHACRDGPILRVFCLRQDFSIQDSSTYEILCSPDLPAKESPDL